MYDPAENFGGGETLGGSGVWNTPAKNGGGLGALPWKMFEKYVKNGEIEVLSRGF